MQIVGLFPLSLSKSFITLGVLRLLTHKRVLKMQDKEE